VDDRAGANAGAKAGPVTESTTGAGARLDEEVGDDDDARGEPRTESYPSPLALALARASSPGRLEQHPIARRRRTAPGRGGMRADRRKSTLKVQSGGAALASGRSGLERLAR
jgi:hypothetical protein